MGREISNSDDVIDSRDVIKRIGELREELEAEAERRAAAIQAGEEYEEASEDAKAELASLEALESEAEGCEDWTHGVGLIRDSYFEDYARELAEDIGAIKSDAQWPNTCIDWEQAARELRMDYTSVEFDGVTYWVR